MGYKDKNVLSLAELLSIYFHFEFMFPDTDTLN